MEIRQLAAVIAVAEAGSVTRAAEVLRLVQPAVSRQIRTLEDELETELFERTKQGMILTEDGKVVLDHARRALRELERARHEVRPAGTALHGLVTVGLLPSVADPRAEAAIAHLRQQHPAVRLRVMVGYDGHLVEWLEAAEVDMAPAPCGSHARRRSFIRIPTATGRGGRSMMRWPRAGSGIGAGAG